jgi:hypothetical protein
MTRERKKEIEQAADEAYPTWEEYNTGFIEGAKWADQHPNVINFAYLQNWYQDSIDEEKEPIWTDKHLEELFNDFYLIPKNVVMK